MGKGEANVTDGAADTPLLPIHTTPMERNLSQSAGSTVGFTPQSIFHKGVLRSKRFSSHHPIVMSCEKTIQCNFGHRIRFPMYPINDACQDASFSSVLGDTRHVDV